MQRYRSLFVQCGSVHTMVRLLRLLILFLLAAAVLGFTLPPHSRRSAIGAFRSRREASRRRRGLMHMVTFRNVREGSGFRPIMEEEWQLNPLEIRRNISEGDFGTRINTSFTLGKEFDHPAALLGTLVWPIVQEVAIAGYPNLIMHAHNLWTRFSRQTGKLMGEVRTPFFWIVFDGSGGPLDLAKTAAHIRKKKLGSHGAVTDGLEWYMVELPDEKDSPGPDERLGLSRMKSCVTFDICDQAQDIVDWILGKLRERAAECPEEWEHTPEWRSTRAAREEAERAAQLEKEKKKNHKKSGQTMATT
ncbi:unnamed protein product [Vitrella brassicaformis CCMP3155]|uniref:Uncharacterized protein n=1 Tax=Vitrella brassicaformis (strain CCMP3155) TaxID=1169540 RepID=A0A0G4FME9_VITBC|nr:unnamed protein product [Vitrella brassicaformis CCMP3155]|eukprot:CEM15272.1 unnamed protein product [Vitrella brassicaformis CCMP3155]